MSKKIRPAEYQIWAQMKSRCTNPNNRKWKDYGGRNIKVCDRWLNSFENFLEDMGTRPSPKHSLDRIDVNGDYTLENCRWSDQKTQQNNKRTNLFITWSGRTLTLAQWSREIGISRQSLKKRIDNGWTIDRALTEPRHRA